MGGDPKRHHWWPQLQSGYWTDENNLIYVTREDGTYFRAQPKDLGVEGHLYSIHLADGKKNVEIEKWLATEIDSPFVGLIPHLQEKSKRQSFPLKGDLSRLESLRKLGYKARGYIDFIGISLEQRRIISNYLAALLIRSPQYLKKLVAFHEA